MPHLSVFEEVFALRKAFRISRGEKSAAQVLRVKLKDGDFIGQGECVPYARYGESLDSVKEQIVSLTADLKQGADNQDLLKLLPAGAARNAVDCALWDLKSKKADIRIWELLALQPKGLVETCFTIGLDTPQNMRKEAEENSFRTLLKLKLAGPEDLERVQQVREGAPESRIIVDANEGWALDEFIEILPSLEALGVVAIEQPLPAGQDACLKEIDSSIPIIADESCHDTASYERIADWYSFINIKLDKTGGLTEAMALKQRALADGKQIMIGCMVGTSLAMAPALLLAQDASIVDLDGPLLLAEDRAHALAVKGNHLALPDRELWG